MSAPPRPYGLLAELKYRCPLHCPYCSNPVAYPGGEDLTTAEWTSAIEQAAELGVLQAGFSGGEPLLRADLAALIATARRAGLYTNLITSGVGLSDGRACELREAGLDSVQISFQSDEPMHGDFIAGTRAHQQKLSAVASAKVAGLPLSLNVVLHRSNLDRLARIIAFAAELGASRLELANAQYYGWAYRNRDQLLPTREQIERAFALAMQAKQDLAGRMEIFYVLPDYFSDRPKPCMHGWGRQHLTINPTGEVLPCPNAREIPNLRFDSVREHSLAWIWQESASFNAFRGTAWMPSPCRDCDRREIDFGGCRCQAALLTGDASRTDPVCALSPDRHIVDRIISAGEDDGAGGWTPRSNPLPHSK
jgi:pyrroloquinoline quinone biosynthesis protein E